MPLRSQGVQAWDRYAYVNNNPVRYTDPTGHWVDTVIDAVSIGYDIYDISNNGLNWENGLSLVADIVSFVIPMVVGGGAMVRAAMRADDAYRAINGVANVTQSLNQLENTAQVVNKLNDLDDLLNIVPTNSNIVVIGESMNRINPISEKLTGIGYNVHTYQPRNFRSTPGNLSMLDIETNRSWLSYWTKEKGATVIDIGLDPRREVRSPFYALERRSIYKNWKYENVIEYLPE